MSESIKDFQDYLNPSIISKINNLDLRARFVVEGFMVGLHKSPYHGFSVEFSQHRPYMQGDNLKDVDWRVFGKTEKYFIKQYEEETNLKCYILLDISKSMSFGSEGNVTKIDYAKTLAAALAYLLIKQQDAVGLTLYSEKVEKSLLPKSSRNYLTEILRELYLAKVSAKTNTAQSLGKVAENIKRRGLVVIISDFFDDLETTLRSIKNFSYQKNEVIVFQILDPLERTFGFGRDAVFKDLESEEELTTQPYQIQKAYKQAMQEFTEKIKRECLNSKFDYNLIETNNPFDKALFSFVQKRAKLH